MAELGRIEKPAAEDFRDKRKLYCVPNVYPIKDAPDEYKSLVERYWDEVVRHTERLENAGKIKKIFCEGISVQGEEAFDALGKINEKALNVIKKKVEEGSLLLPLEDEEIFDPFLDWTNCLSVVRTKEVFMKVFEFYSELSDKRIKHMQNLIETSLSDGEAGMLIMRDEDRIKLQFPSDIEVFLVTPPSYDDILKWFREKMKDLS